MCQRFQLFLPSLSPSSETLSLVFSGSEIRATEYYPWVSEDALSPVSLFRDSAGKGNCEEGFILPPSAGKIRCFPAVLLVWATCGETPPPHRGVLCHHTGNPKTKNEPADMP